MRGSQRAKFQQLGLATIPHIITAGKLNPILKRIIGMKKVTFGNEAREKLIKG